MAEKRKDYKLKQQEAKGNQAAAEAGPANAEALQPGEGELKDTDEAKPFADMPGGLSYTQIQKPKHCICNSNLPSCTPVRANLHLS